MSVPGSAGGAGERPRASSLERMKESRGTQRAELVARSAGKGGGLIGCQHQWSPLRLARSKSESRPDALVAASPGQGAPICTHLVSAASSSAGKRDLGGI